MTNIRGAFSFKFDRRGASVAVGDHEISVSCVTSDEVDDQIQKLKDELDVVSDEMKKVISSLSDLPPYHGRAENA